MTDDPETGGTWEEMFASHIRDKQASPLVCPICGVPNPFEPRGTIGGRMADDVLRPEFQFGYAACNNCGYSIFFDAKLTGLRFVDTEDSELGSVGPYMSYLQAVVENCAESVISPSKVLKSEVKEAIIKHSRKEGRAKFDGKEEAKNLLYFFVRNGWLPEDRDDPQYVWINYKTLEFLYD